MAKRRRSKGVAQRAAVLLPALVAACASTGGGAGTPASPAGGGAGAAPVHGPPPPRSEATVRLGVDRVAAGELDTLLRGRRLGLITNHTGRTATGESTIDVLHERPGFELTALFGPEHGIRGTARPGEKVTGGRDARTGLPIYSLYGETEAPTDSMLAGLDALVYDIQDVGTRYYTYAWTMALAMKAAARHGLEFIVLDRPDPLGGAAVQGNVLDTTFATFVGLYPVPMRYGMTAGELARMLNGSFRIGAKLTVVPMAGWQRGLYFDETGLPWTAPSPNMPSLESAIDYPGTCLFEGTNLSVGRGTPLAFQQVGAPWLDAAAVAARLNARELPGVRFDAVRFTPEHPADGKYAGVAVNGLRFVTTDRARYDPVRASVAALLEIHAAAPDSLRWIPKHFDRLAGTDRLRGMIERNAPLEEIVAPWAAQRTAFEARRRPALLYPPLAADDPRAGSGVTGAAWRSLERRIRARVAAEAPDTVAVRLVDLGSGEAIGVNDEVEMHAASTMKVPVLLELYRQAAAGRFSLDDSVVVKNTFRSIADGSSYSLSPKDDSELELYRRVGTRLPIRELARRMIVRSSNLATNNLIDLVTADSVAAEMQAIGADGMHVLRGVEDIPAFNRGMNNRTTAAALARVLEVVARCDAATPPDCRDMTDILSEQEFNDMIPAGLPAGTPVAHKTGWITGIQHDGAIVYPPHRAPYVLVVMTHGYRDEKAAKTVGAEISAMVWKALVR